MMPKVIPVPDDVSQPFWDAVNQKRLVIQHCTACTKLQYPPQPTCQVCGSAEALERSTVAQTTRELTQRVIQP